MWIVRKRVRVRGWSTVYDFKTQNYYKFLSDWWTIIIYALSIILSFFIREW